MLHLYESLFRAGYGEHPERFLSKDGVRAARRGEDRLTRRGGGAPPACLFAARVL